MLPVFGRAAEARCCLSWVRLLPQWPHPLATVLFEADRSWDGTPYGAYPAGDADIKIVKIVIPPNSRLGSHTHPMPNIAYVHAGALTVKSEADGLERQLKQGDFLAEMVNKPHYGYTGDEGVELFLVYCGVTGQELSVSTK